MHHGWAQDSGRLSSPADGNHNRSIYTFNSVSPQINQKKADHHQNDAEATQTAIGYFQYLGDPEFHFLRKSKIGKPFHNHYHSHHTQKKFHNSHP